MDPHQFLGLEISPRRRHRRNGPVDRVSVMALPHPGGSGLPPSPILAISAGHRMPRRRPRPRRRRFATDERGVPSPAGMARPPSPTPSPVSGAGRIRQVPGALRQPRPASWRTPTTSSATRPSSVPAPCGRRWGRLYRGPARRLAVGTRIRRFRHVLVAPRRLSCPFQQDQALRFHHHQQPEADLQPPRPRTTPDRRAALLAYAIPDHPGWMLPTAPPCASP